MVIANIQKVMVENMGSYLRHTVGEMAGQGKIHMRVKAYMSGITYRQLQAGA